MATLALQLQQLTATDNDLKSHWDSTDHHPGDSFIAPTTHFGNDQWKSQTITDWMQPDRALVRAPPWPDPDPPYGLTSYNVPDWQHQLTHAPPLLDPDPPYTPMAPEQVDWNVRSNLDLKSPYGFRYFETTDLVAHDHAVYAALSAVHYTHSDAYGAAAHSDHRPSEPPQ